MLMLVQNLILSVFGDTMATGGLTAVSGGWQH